MLDTVKINHVQHISFTQSRLTDAVSVILSELLSYEHPSKVNVRLKDHFAEWRNAARRRAHNGDKRCVYFLHSLIVQHTVCPSPSFSMA